MTSSDPIHQREGPTTQLLSSIPRRPPLPAWFGGIATGLFVLGFELIRSAGGAPPIPFPLLMIGVVLSAHWVGLNGGKCQSFQGKRS